ncbi:ferredoxin [Amycolatopsis acidicola]|uniref:Ferredoxin n=1 Tax=Amycolatopsis acidicola TaxID=2596893 RepID=A0A5N0UJK3_9PSEU|nr:ferredoxin [Amycolatopsis acidicola]KAA9148628.1 ferredoxin [Amycolatopsis acidicola]
MFISIDGSRCMGHGRCYTMAETLLSDDDEGFVAERGQRWQVAAELADEAVQARDACPEAAITLGE